MDLIAFVIFEKSFAMWQTHTRHQYAINMWRDYNSYYFLVEVEEIFVSRIFRLVGLLKCGLCSWFDLIRRVEVCLIQKNWLQVGKIKLIKVTTRFWQSSPKNQFSQKNPLHNSRNFGWNKIISIKTFDRNQIFINT